MAATAKRTAKSKATKTMLNDEVQARLQDPMLQKQIAIFLKSTYRYGLACGKRGLPLRWHNGLPLKGKKHIMSDHPDIVAAKEMLMEQGKQLASIVFGKAYSRCTQRDVLHLYAFVSFIDYEMESVTSRSSETAQQTIERRVTTLNTRLATTFIQDRLNKGIFDENKAKRAYSSLAAVQEEVLQERQLGNYLFPRITFKAKQTTRHKEAIRVGDKRFAYAPVLMLQGYIKGLRKAIGDNVVTVYYTKVNQQIRKQTVTFNQSYIDEVYKDNPYVMEDFYTALGYDITEDVSEVTVPLQPGVPSEFLMDNMNLWSGLWRVADFGASPLDPSPIRNISLLRIYKIAKVPFNPEVYKKFTYIDLKNTVPYFVEKYQGILEKDPVFAAELTNVFIKTLKLDPTTTAMTLLMQIEIQVALGTQFRKKLHLLLEALPEVFTDYSGAIVPTVDLGASDLDEAEIVDLDGDLFED